MQRRVRSTHHTCRFGLCQQRRRRDDNQRCRRRDGNDHLTHLWTETFFKKSHPKRDSIRYETTMVSSLKDVAWRKKKKKKKRMCVVPSLMRRRSAAPRLCRFSISGRSSKNARPRLSNLFQAAVLNLTHNCSGPAPVGLRPAPGKFSRSAQGIIN